MEKRRNIHLDRIPVKGPEYWEGLCSLEETQFCGLTEEGYWHGISPCQDCSYLKKEDKE